MTCVWDASLKGLKKFPEFGLQSLNRPQFIEFCQKNCDVLLEKYKNIIYIPSERSEDEKLDKITEKQVKENYIPHIKTLDEKDKTNGYECNGCNSLLLFICCYFEINVHFKGRNWNNKEVKIQYLYNKPGKEGSSEENKIGYENNKALFFQASKSHFSYVSYVN